MPQDCCSQHTKQTDSLKMRGLALRNLGALSLAPPIETILSTGLSGIIGSSMLLSFIMYCIAQDFADKRLFTAGLTTGLSLILSASLMLTSATTLLCLATGLVICASLLFTEYTPTSGLSLSMPSTEKIILLLSLLNSILTAGSMLFPWRKHVCLLLHEPLIILGTYYLSTWFKQSMQSDDIVHSGLTVEGNARMMKVESP